MDPLAIALQGIGIGLKFWGDSRARKAERAISAEKMNQIKYSMEQNQVEALRSTRNAIRASQAARAMAINAGANSGADIGSSGIQGGADAAMQAGVLQGNIIDQNLDYATLVAKSNLNIAKYGGDVADARAWGDLGSSLAGGAGKISDVTRTAVAWSNQGNWDTQVTWG